MSGEGSGFGAAVNIVIDSIPEHTSHVRAHARNFPLSHVREIKLHNRAHQFISTRISSSSSHACKAVMSIRKEEGLKTCRSL